MTFWHNFENLTLELHYEKMKVWNKINRVLFEIWSALLVTTCSLTGIWRKEEDDVVKEHNSLLRKGYCTRLVCALGNTQTKLTTKVKEIDCAVGCWFWCRHRGHCESKKYNRIRDKCVNVLSFQCDQWCIGICKMIVRIISFNTCPIDTKFEPNCLVQLTTGNSHFWECWPWNSNIEIWERRMRLQLWFCLGDKIAGVIHSGMGNVAMWCKKVFWEV